MKEGRQAVNYYALASKRALTIIKGDTKRSRYGCEEGCPFRCLISKDGKTEGFKIKTLINNHTCEEAFFNPRADSTTLAKYFRNKLQNNPKYKVKDMRGELENNFTLNVCQSKLKRAKRMTLEKLEGSFIDEYNKLEAYAQEIRRSNPESDVVINISKDALAEGKTQFLRMYLCFDALKKGWKRGLRPLIGVDGTFLKGRCKGMLLVALGQDCMNSFYPLAWAIVDKETSRTWSWFIELLKRSLDLKDGAGTTFTSDMQKGLVDVVDKVLPGAHHRFCMRHVESNWCKKWRSGEMRKLMWWCSWSSYDEEFKDQLKKLGQLSEEAARDLVNFPPRAWCRAYFDTQCKNMTVDNNFTESFNSWILVPRGKPIIKMLEKIRVKVMNLLVKNENKTKTWGANGVSPECMNLFNDWRSIAHRCKVEFNGYWGYKVSDGEDRHTVNLEHKKCTCRLWDLSGIPCPHAIKVLIHKKVIPETKIHWWYTKEAYILTYKHKMQPVRGERSWKVEASHAMLPPDVVKQVGRPKWKRDREPDKARKRKGEWSQSRKGTQMTCRNCDESNQNAKGCCKEKSTENASMKGKSPMMESNSQSRIVGQEDDLQQIQVATQDFEPYGPNVGNEEDPPLRPMVYPESKSWVEKLMARSVPTGTRKISFTGDHTGVSVPTNLSYSPVKTTWKGKKAVSSGQLQMEAKKKKNQNGS
ncbi:uncharacterized protein LOC107879869 [Capsicum annuum]|uniref:uncharacterized protein LOC107879869 n=1 Tax=Capsicum annuum TaxID=4072 RepID=UPI001FB11CA4|nr:uncharacterized protein LOC107879869 [Capsicum annuum]